jgi:hypothetical protein
MVKHAGTIIFVKMNPAFRIAASLECVPTCSEVTLQLWVIKKLTIKSDPDVMRFVTERLATTCKIDD